MTKGKRHKQLNRFTGSLGSYLNDIYIYENETTKHILQKFLAKKKYFYRLVHEDPEYFIRRAHILVERRRRKQHG